MVNVFDKFTARARQAVVQAHEAARARRHDFIGTEHVLLGLIANDDDAVVSTLRAVGVEPSALRARVDEHRPAGQAPPSGHIPFTPRSKQTLERSLHEAQLRCHELIDAEHLLCALTREPAATAAVVLDSCGASCDAVRGEIEQQWRTDGDGTK